MGFLSVSTQRGLVHCQGLLLLGLLLTFWSLPVTAKISVVSLYTRIGSDAILLIHNKPPAAVGFVWYKGKTVDVKNIIAFSFTIWGEYVSGPGYKGAEMMTDDGHLLLKNVTVEDEGTYTVEVHLPDSKTEIGSGVLQVDDYLRGAMLMASSNQFRENEDHVVLTCYTKGTIIWWLFNDGSLPSTRRMTLTMNDKRLIISPVKREDAGVYKCRAWLTLRWAESLPFVLDVLH